MVVVFIQLLQTSWWPLRSNYWMGDLHKSCRDGFCLELLVHSNSVTVKYYSTVIDFVWSTTGTPSFRRIMDSAMQYDYFTAHVIIRRILVQVYRVILAQTERKVTLLTEIKFFRFFPYFTKKSISSWFLWNMKTIWKYSRTVYWWLTHGKRVNWLNSKHYFMFSWP